MKTSIAFLATSALALVTLSGCETPASPGAAAGATPASQCLDTRKIQSIIPQDSLTVNVITYGGDAFELKLGSPCLDMRPERRPQINSHGHDLVCGAGDAEIFYPGSNLNQTCRVTAVRRLSAEEAAKVK